MSDETGWLGFSGHCIVLGIGGVVITFMGLDFSPLTVLMTGAIAFCIALILGLRDGSND